MQPFLYYWNSRKTLQQSNSQQLLLVENGIFDLTTQNILINKPVQLFSLNEQQLIYCTVKDSIFIKSNMKTHEIRYPVHPYTTFIDFPQDIQNDKVLRRKSLEWLDFEKLVIKLKYQPEDSYLSAFYDDNDVCYVASGTFLSRICFKSLQTIDFCKIHSRINCVQKIDKFIVIGTMMGDVIFTDLTGNIVFQFMISSIVKGPIGQFKEYKKLIFAIGHRIITKINITNQKFEIFAEFGSIYGIVFDEIKGTCLVACDTGLISLVID